MDSNRHFYVLDNVKFHVRMTNSARVAERSGNKNVERYKFLHQIWNKITLAVVWKGFRNVAESVFWLHRNAAKKVEKTAKS